MQPGTHAYTHARTSHVGCCCCCLYYKLDTEKISVFFFSVCSSCPKRPAKCGWEAYSQPGPNPQILYGALVSGPDENDYYEDKREEYVYNEVTLDYNAGFQSAVAGLRHLQLINDNNNNMTNVKKTV